MELQELHGLGTWPWPEQRRQEGMMEMDFGGSWDWAGGRVDGGGVFGVERWVPPCVFFFFF